MSRFYDQPFVEENFKSGCAEGLPVAKMKGIYAKHYFGCIISLHKRINEIIPSTKVQ